MLDKFKSWYYKDKQRAIITIIIVIVITLGIILFIAFIVVVISLIKKYVKKKETGKFIKEVSKEFNVPEKSQEQLDIEYLKKQKELFPKRTMHQARRTQAVGDD